MAETIEITGTVTKAEPRRFEDLYGNHYNQGKEYYKRVLMVAIETERGEKFWFYSPGALEWISMPYGSPVAVNCAEENDWFDELSGTLERGGNKYTKKGKQKIKEGDTISIRGKAKRKTKYGLQLNYVKLLKGSVQKKLFEEVLK